MQLSEPTILFNKKLSHNAQGRDYFAGDVHGHLDLLETQMRRVGFNGSYDRLFLVGDLIDRGPFSQDTLDLLQEPYVHAVMGNHEWMYVHAAHLVQHLLNSGTFEAWNGREDKWADFGYMGTADAAWFQQDVDNGRFERIEHNVKLICDATSFLLSFPDEQMHMTHTHLPWQTDVIMGQTPDLRISILTQQMQNMIFSFQLGKNYEMIQKMPESFSAFYDKEWTTVVGHFGVKDITFFDNHVMMDTGYHQKDVGFCSLEDIRHLKEQQHGKIYSHLNLGN